MPIGRNRAGLVAVILAASASFALAAGVISESLRDLERYLKAASSLAIQITTGLDGAKFDTLQPAQREAAARQLQTLSEGLAEIFQSQTSLVHNLDFYLTIAKDPARTPSERDSFWNRMVLGPARVVYKSVSQLKDFVASGEQLFSVTLSNEERLELADNLRARRVTLRSFERMPPPVSSEEVLQLEGTISHYKILIANLGKLRIAVNGALRRLKST